MVSRKLQEQKGAFWINIPIALIHSLDLKRGDRLSVKLVSGKIEIQPVITAVDSRGVDDSIP
jgi:antitoxin component of MazEF toxin-antitoxin module